MSRKTNSFWIATPSHSPYSSLKQDLETDVIIIGGGITGLTAALLLKLAGQKVVLLEQTEIGIGESGHTTAHITEELDTRYSSIISHFGHEYAKQVVESSRAAINKIENIIDELDISCDFKRVPAYLYTVDSKQVKKLRQELQSVESLGIIAHWTKNIPLPFKTRGAIQFSNQAQFHPRKYMIALARKIQGDGCHIFEQTRAVEIQDGEPCVVKTPEGTVRARKIIMATHTPSFNRVVLHTKIAAYRTYAIGAYLSHPPSLTALYWDTADPYHYIRNEGDLWIIGGEDHKTGTLENTDEQFKNLENFADSNFQIKSVQFRWSGQVLEPVDGLPYIGLNPNSQHVYVATGFSGNGMTFGTVSGMLLSDLILGRKNSWAEVYNPSRIRPKASAKDYISENKDYPVHMIKDRISPPTARSLDQVPNGTGRIMRVHGKKIAVYRDYQGEVHSFSATCPHLGCNVNWNSAENSWDCPCHGSRFDTDGKVMNGPAIKDLTPVAISESKDEAEPKPKVA